MSTNIVSQGAQPQPNQPQSHTYVILTATSQGDVCTITGTVDGAIVTINPWVSAISALPNTASIQSFIATLMLSEAQASGAVATPISSIQSVLSLGTFIQ